MSPYDAELFGHWWHEGPVFLEAVLREAAADDALELTTPGVYLARHPRLELVQPPLSSWGAHGYAGVWLSPANDWIYPHLERAARTLVALVRTHVEPAPLVRRALAQAARELLLAQASDWAFMLHTGTTVDYARRRLDAHLGRFARLAALVGRGGRGRQFQFSGAGRDCRRKGLRGTGRVNWRRERAARRRSPCRSVSRFIRR